MREGSPPPWLQNRTGPPLHQFLVLLRGLVPPRRLISLLQVIFDAFLFFRALAPFTSVAAQTADGDVSAPRSPVVRCHVCPLLCPQVGIRLQDFWFLEQEVDKLHALVRGALGFLRFLFLSLPARLWKPEQPAVIFTLTW